jgi:proteasome lid subunit RPN8/RPN11
MRSSETSPAPYSLEVPRDIVEDTLEALRSFGRRGYEGLVLWLGEVNEAHASVTNFLVPPQESVRSEDGVGYLVSGDTLFEVNRLLSQHRLRLVAQVHSHPGPAYHSEADDRYAIVTADGGYSFVVPNFAEHQRDMTGWAAYRLTDRCWRELEPNEIVASVSVR